MLRLPLPLCTYAIITTCPFSKAFWPLSSQRHLPVDETHSTHETGDTGIVRLAISQATNKKNTSPVTVPDNRCSITEPLDEHQLCTIIWHVHEVCCLAHRPAYFVRSQLYPSGARHIIVRRVRWCAPTPDYRTCGNFTARFWLTHKTRQVVMKLWINWQSFLGPYRRVVCQCQIKKLHERQRYGFINGDNTLDFQPFHFRSVIGTNWVWSSERNRKYRRIKD